MGKEIGHDPLQVLFRGQAQLGEGSVVPRQRLTGAGPVARQDPGSDDVAQVVQGGIDQQRVLGGGVDLDGEVGVEGPVLGGRGAGGDAGCGIDQRPGLFGDGESIPHRGGEPVAQSAQGGQGGFDARIGARRWRGGLALWRGGVRRRRPAGGRREIDGPESANCHRVDLCDDLRVGNNADRRAVSCIDRRRPRGLVDSHRGLLTHRPPGAPRPGTGLSLPEHRSSYRGRKAAG